MGTRAVNPKKIVADGYDVIGTRYAQQAVKSRTEDRERYTAMLLKRLPVGAEVLDLGCGAGLLTTARLAERFAVTGIDISPRQVERARLNVPGARFTNADMTEVELPPAGFDGVAAFFSVIHVPRDEHPELFRRVSGWLRPGGLFVAAMGARAKQANFAGDFMGAPMYWSGYDTDTNTNKRLIEEAGLAIEVAQEATYHADGVPGRFLWIVAEKTR